MLALFVWCLIVTSVTRALCLVFDCYVSDTHSLCYVSDCFVSDALPLCLVFDSYVIDAGSLRTDLRYLSLVAIEIAAKMTDWSSRTRLKILE